MRKILILSAILVLTLIGCSANFSNSENKSNGNEAKVVEPECKLSSPFSSETVLSLRKLISEKWDYKDEIVIIGPIKIDYYTSLGSYFYTYAVDKNRTLQSPSCYQYSDTEAGIEINYSSVEDRDFWTDFNDKDHNALFVKGTVIINSETYKLHINATEIKFAK